MSLPSPRIAILGPESCGKSTLAVALAQALTRAGQPAQWLEEYAREFYATRAYRPTPEQVEAIAVEQSRREDAVSGRIAVCDTTALTCLIWAEEAFGAASETLQRLARRPYTLTLLTATDVPWEYDPLRSHPLERDRLFARHVAQLQALGVEYVVVDGPHERRLQQALAAWQNCLKFDRPGKVQPDQTIV